MMSADEDNEAHTNTNINIETGTMEEELPIVNTNTNSIIDEALPWPEDDPQRPHHIFQKLADSLFYPYMKHVLKRGAELHKERSLYQSNSTHSSAQGHGDAVDANVNANLVNDINVKVMPQELSQSDLFKAPPYMRAEVLQSRFYKFHAKRHEDMMTKIKAKHDRQQKRKRKRQGTPALTSSSSTNSSIKLSRKAKGWVLIKTLWDVSQPTYLYAAGAQLVTVVVQCGYPLIVQQLLKLVERHPNENLFSKGIGYAILLFLCSVTDGIAQERQKFLAFQSGITIKTATSSAIYHHMLNLSSKGKQQLLMGETTNLVAIDCQKLFEVCQEGHLLWSCPLSMLIVMILLLAVLGPATLVGMVSMFLLVPLVKMVVEKMMSVRKQRAVHTDRRVDTTTAMLQAIRFCKLNHYEQKFLDRVSDARRKEMKWVKKELRYMGLTLAMAVLTPVVASALTFITYALINGGNVLTPSDTFTTMLLFMALRFPINYAGKLMGKAAQGFEACERIGYFLDRDINANECNDRGKEDSLGEEEGVNMDAAVLEVKNGTFKVGGYENDEDGVDIIGGNTDPGVSGHSVIGKATFTVSGINFSVKQGETLACVGPVGSGKSTLLHALVGDVAAGSSEITIRGSVAYASQSPFILNATLRENILFGLEYKKDLYDRVLEACNLLPDLKQLGPSKDLTEIGERGVTLSGGQKARISLARCVYSQPSVALFDDILSALDASTGKWIFERLFESSNATNGSNLLSRSAVVLVTHASYFLSRVDKILVLVKGKSAFIGNWDGLLAAQPEDEGAREVISSICSSVQEKDEDTSDDEKDKQKGAKPAPGTKGAGEQKDAEHGILMTEEERDFGLSDWSTWLTWFKFAGGFLFISVTVVSLSIDRGFYVINEWWLASWTSAAYRPIERFGIIFAAQSDGLAAQYEFIKVFVIILVISFAGTIVRSLIIIQGGARSAEKLFNNMTERVMRAPMSYFETTPMGRILNRLTYDVEILDISLSTSMAILMISVGWFVTGVVLQITILPWNVLALLPVVVLYWFLLLFYRKSAVDLQRLDAVSRSPVQANLSEGIDGSTTIKAFGKINFFERQFRDTLDDNTSAMMNFMAAQRWLGARFQTLGSFVVLFATVFVVSYNSVLALETGYIAMLLIWTYNFTVTLAFFSQAISESEAYLTSVERARDMADLPQESEFETKPEYSPEATWPSDGNLVFDDVCLRYRPRLPLALKNLSFTAKPGQRVGICGRTGAGKSSIAVALFRLAELDSGRILLDGHDLSKLGLGDVRGRKKAMCIIPQDPVLIGSSLRECLDPWGQSSDEDILEALKSVKVADAEDRGTQALDDYVDEGGRNFSVGERQLICLARAVLSQPRVLVLDEATASVDGETDAFIQKMIRSRFKGTTLLTIAHRLNTIMDYDVILVMDKGNVAEFGAPKDLLSDANGIFSSLVDSTGKESSLVLRKMVQ